MLTLDEIFDLEDEFGIIAIPSDFELETDEKADRSIPFDLMPGMTRTFTKSEEAPAFQAGVSLTPRQRAKNCKTGIACGDSCISKNKTCKKTLPPAVQAQKPPAAKKTKKQSGTTATIAPPAPSTPSAPSGGAIKTNQAELDSKRADLTKRFGKKLVEAAEKNVQRILEDPDNDVYIRVGSSDTLEKILGNRFLTSAELGMTQHKVPYLNDDYQTARNRVEAKVLGYDPDTTKPDERPIYGYLGGKDLDGDSHRGTDDYGSIVVKLKPEIKERATFTGADSFKSGIASELVSNGTPPPPNAASLVSSTRHGYDKDALPGGYPASYKSKAGDKEQLSRASTARDLDSLVNYLAPSGARYVETQLHGGVRPSDIAELRFDSFKAKPTAQVAKLAADNGIDVYVDGKKLTAKQLKALSDGSSVKPPQNGAYKPKMSKAEADDYTRDSVWKDKVFYHGTSGGAADNITTQGVDPFRTSTSYYGKGFYTTTDKQTANAYAMYEASPTRVGCKLNVKKPFVVQDHDDMKRQMKKMGVNMQPKNQTEDTAIKIRETLLKKGFDAIEVRKHQYFIPLNQDQVAVFEAKKAN